MLFNKRLFSFTTMMNSKICIERISNIINNNNTYNLHIIFKSENCYV